MTLSLIASFWNANFVLSFTMSNNSFELAGARPGEAASWDVKDDANLLSDPGAGVSIGRIIPVSFTPIGTYVMCLGDETLVVHPSFSVY
jgi:hypothetical protein